MTLTHRKDGAELDVHPNLSGDHIHKERKDIQNCEDKQQQARKICEKNWGITEQEIADALGVRRQTVSNWVSDIKLKQKTERQAVIYRLNLLGWAQEEIAEALGLTQQAVSEKLQVLAELPKLVKTFLDRGDSVEEMAGKLNLDVQLAWSMALEGFDDKKVSPCPQESGCRDV